MRQGVALLAVRAAVVLPHPLLAPDAPVLLLIGARPFLRAVPREGVVQHLSRFRVDPVEDDVEMRMRGVVVADIDRLVLLPSHVREIAVGRPQHLLLAGLLARVPGERDGHHRLLALAPREPDPAHHLEVVLVAERGDHLGECLVSAVMGRVARLRPGDAPVREPQQLVLGALVMQVVELRAAEGGAGLDVGDHGAEAPFRARPGSRPAAAPAPAARACPAR